jgi:anti-sigma-K factor RskA
MGNFDWSSIPTWVWILLAVAAVIVVPIKLNILKKLMGKKDSQAPMED